MSDFLVRGKRGSSLFFRSSRVLGLIAMVAFAQGAWAVACTSLSAGSWNSAGRWSCGHVPLAADTVVIAHNITLDTNRTIAGLTVNAGVTLSGNNRNLRVSGPVVINGTYNTGGGDLTTTSSGSLTVNAGGTFNFNNGNAAINGNVAIYGTLTSGGDNIQMTGANTTLSGTGNVINTTIEIDATGVSVPVGASLSFDANSEIDVAANVSPASLTVYGTIDGTAQGVGDRIIRVSTGGSLTVGSSGVINAPNSRLDVRDGASATNNGAIAIGDLRGRTGAPAPVFTQGVDSTLSISMAVCIPANPCTFDASAAGNTVNFNGAAQTVYLPSGSAYSNLTLSGSGAKAVPTGLTVAGNFTMSGTATATAPAAIAVGGNFSIGAGSTFTPGTGTVTLNGAAIQTIGGGTADLSLFNLAVNNPAGIRLARNVVVTGTLSGSVTLTSTCPTDYTLTSNGGATVAHSCPPVLVVSSINCAVSCAATGPAAAVTWSVTFSASVTGVDASAFALVASGLTGASITGVSGSGTTWTVSASSGLGAGTLGLNQIGPGSISPALSGTFTGQVYTISAPPLLAEYRMDEALWNGTANEVVDASGNGNNAQAFNGASTLGTIPAIPGNPGSCNYGVFDNGGSITQGYVQTPLPNLTTNFTVTAWIRSTSTLGGQRILIDDQDNSGGYGISLGDGTAGRIRFYSRGITPVILDSAYTIAINTWYFVAAVADISNKKRSIYVFDAAGTLLANTTEAAWTAGAWGTDAGPVSIGGETNASGEPPATFHFRGNLDEVRVYQSALSQAAVTAIATQSHACAVAVSFPNHYELSMPTSSVACLPTTVTVTACADGSSPCTNPFVSVSGSTATLATSGGTLGTTAVTFNPTGVASTTLSYPAAPDGTPATVTLSNEPIAATNPRQWCPDGTACVAANSGSTTFNTAGFIFSAAAGGGVATIPAQVAGTSSATNVLRAVKTGSTTQACEAALTGASAVNFAYECNNPSSCYASNLMSVNAGAATTIARNNNGSVLSYLPVNMNFDANGNAPFTFNYSDVGQVKLWVSKPPGGSLLSTLTGSSNAFVVKPGGFAISNIKQTAAPQLANPAAANAAGAKFVKAGENFTINVSATTTPASGAAITPSYGRELAPESVKLTPTLVAPAGGAAGTFSGTFGAFTNGAATGTAFAWTEVGIIAVAASVGDGDYLGAGDTSGTSSGNIGRFFPDHFDTVVTPEGGGFAYSGNPAGPVPGQPFTVAVTARNALAAPTANYNYAGGVGFARDINLSLPVGTGQLYVDAVAGGTGAVPASKFLNLAPGEGKVNFSDATGKISFAFTSLPHAAQTIQIHAEDSDTATSSGANGSINIRHGRLRVFNAFGSEKAALSVPLRAEYWGGNSWLINADDNFSLIPNTSIGLSVVSPATLGTSASGTTLVAGQGSVVLAIPTPGVTGNTGSIDLAINLGAGVADQSCLSGHPATTGAAIPWLRSINGNCAVSYDRDPAARASFGIYAPETRKTIHVRELF